ncbi:sugar nucleotide-binding protein [Pseudomonas oryzihabitans]|uniref:sugar nucleotide-binding protein n=1 Tax=Pseudomonas oryzihabitans TaxID=47885 RepID=UPI00285C0E4C|nr:sugar nucleotide-binding protein [Pseudomonas psychrotolerans]MDR6677991.1 dTDP-4-dehydrorhamnose reductase [Pseudomonas psychrotolerans]
MRMRLLVVGGESALGKALLTAGAEAGIEFIAPDRPAEGWYAAGLTEALDRVRPGAVINLAYYHDWLQAADFEPAAMQRQALAVQRLAGLCQHYQIPLIQPSSYRLFDGSRVAGYSEKDLPRPPGARGEALWRVEQLVRALCPMHILLRLGWVLDDSVDGRLGRLLRQMNDEQVVPRSGDRRGNPTTVGDAARVLLAIVKQLDCGAPLWGTYHYGAQEAVSELGLAETLATLWQEFDRPVHCEWQDVPHQERADAAEEPQHGVLISRKLLNTFGIKARRWQQELPALLQGFRQDEVGFDE